MKPCGFSCSDSYRDSKSLEEISLDSDAGTN
jgi:hypothetical protein